MLTDGGIAGVLAGDVFYSSAEHCGVDTYGSGIAVQICWTNPNCTGTPYVQGLTAPAQYSFGGSAVMTYPSIVGRCFSGGGPQGGNFRLAEPIQLVPVQLWSCYRHNQAVCDQLTSPLTSAYALVAIQWPVFPPAGGFSLIFP